MSHSTEFKAPGWGHAVLIHDGYGMPGTVELRAWGFAPHARKCIHPTVLPDNICGLDRYKGTKSCEAHLGEPDFECFLGEDGVVACVDEKHPQRGSSSDVCSLLYRAGLVVGASRLEAKITDVLEGYRK